jgi:uncharacterized membrane protein YphA (DoxX/SURF4 family)
MKSNNSHTPEKLSQLPIIALVILRLAIGWHFLYEGAVKLFDPNWTSAAFLAESQWLFSGVFHAIVQNETLLNIVDFMNVWGLILIGLALFFGCLSRTASVFGVLLLALYYIASPALISSGTGIGTEGNYLLINKNIVELIALVVLALVPTGKHFGIDGIIALWRNRKKPEPASSEQDEKTAPATARRELLKHMATIPLFSGFIYAYMKKRGWESYEVRHLLSEADTQLDAVSSATIKTFQFSKLKDLTGTMTYGKIGDLELSRLFLGGNLIGGWAHARDLIYVSKLIKSYHTDERVFQTLRLAEECGINTLLTNPQLSRVINAYWRKAGGNIQFISDCGYKGDPIKGLEMSIDGGAKACYVQGNMTEKITENGEFDVIAKFLDMTRSHGLPAGIGAHDLNAIKACVERGLKPDFWVKTLHRTDYWSARLEPQKDNIWCTDPKATIEYMNDLEEPWIAFKTMAAGAILPQQAFKYAFENGADFVCAGMYDFQIVDDTNIATTILARDLNRKRPWRA